MPSLITSNPADNPDFPVSREQFIEAAIKLWGDPTHKGPNEWRFGTFGSKSIKLDDLVWFDYEEETVGSNGKPGGGAIELCRLAGLNVQPFPQNRIRREPGIRATFDYRDEKGLVLFQVVRRETEDHAHRFYQRHRDFTGEWANDIKGIRRVLYRLPELLAADSNAVVFVCEGEKDAENLAKLGFVTTTCPMGAKKWKPEYNSALRGKIVVILPDHNKTGRLHAEMVAKSLTGIAASVHILQLPRLEDERDDVSVWIQKKGGTAEELRELVRGIDLTPVDIKPEDFYAYMPAHTYIYVPTGEFWTAGSVNARLGQIDGAKASLWLDRNRPVEQMSWLPGAPMLLKNRIIIEGGFIDHAGATCFNFYRPPSINGGDPAKAGPWLEHCRRLYPNDTDHIVKWCAQRVQQPQVKINHALVLGGGMRIGKDSMFEPVRRAVGSHNVTEVSPAVIMGRFNTYLKSVILRVNEARDLGEVNRFAFYDHMKAYIASPPEVLRIDEKMLREHSIPNVCGIVITTNHKADGIFLPAEDGRHYVAWSDAVQEDFDEAYFPALWAYYDAGGYAHVAAYLRHVDLGGFNPKAPPPRTRAFWEIVDASRAPEDAELADAIDLLGNPAVLTLENIKTRAAGDFLIWLNDRRNRRQIPYRLEQCGYVPVRSDTRKDGLWIINNARQVVYARKELPLRDQLVAADDLARRSGQ